MEYVIDKTWPIGGPLQLYQYSTLPSSSFASINNSVTSYKYTITVPQKPFRLINFSLKNNGTTIPPSRFPFYSNTLLAELIQKDQIMSVYELTEGEPFSIYTLSINRVSSSLLLSFTPSLPPLHRPPPFPHSSFIITGSQSII